MAKTAIVSGALPICPMPDLYLVGRQMPVALEFIVELFPLPVRKLSNKRVFFHDHENSKPHHGRGFF
jgi:hypothetical protein